MTANHPLHSPQPGTWKPIGIVTGAALDCGPQPSLTSLPLGWSVIAVKPSGRGGRHGGAVAGLLTKIHQKVCQNIIFKVMSEVQKDSEDIFAGTGI